MNPAQSDIRLWQLISPAFPVGMFAWSQGLEYAVEAGWVTDEASTLAWIQGQAEHNLMYLDLPLLQRFYDSDPDDSDYWAQVLWASREARELNDEDYHLGQTLARVLQTLQVPGVAELAGRERTSYLQLYAIACKHWKIDLLKAVHAYLWSWAENQVAAAIKVIPLGHLAGQKILSQFIAQIEQLAERGLSVADEEIGMTLPALALASARHEQQYTRLFRS